MIKVLLLETAKVLLFNICTIILGITIPGIIAILISVSTEYTLTQCVISVPFGWSAIVLSIDARAYLNKKIVEYHIEEDRKKLEQQQKKEKKDKKDEPSS